MWGLWKVFNFLIYRLLSVLLIKTQYVPDEFWQSLEVAHNMVFGYGYLTWEWKHGVRSSFYPFMFASVYKVLDVLNIDFPSLVIFLPRVLQALLTAESDRYFFLLCKHFEFDTHWTRMLILTNWFWFYCGSRTLINTFETCLTTIALYHYPWYFVSNKMKDYQKLDTFLPFKLKEKSLCYLIPAAVICIVRPTAVTIWGPLVLFHLYCTPPKFLKELILHCFVPVVFFVLLTSMILDYIWYGSFVIPALNFFIINITEGVASFYGTHPFYWYITQGLPVVLGLHYFSFILGLLIVIIEWLIFEECRFKIIVSTIIFNLMILSFIPHKEFRFLLPLTPLMMLVVGRGSTEFFTPEKKKMRLLWTASLVLGFIIPTFLFGTAHQAGTMALTDYLRNATLTCNHNCSFLYLMPCHSTPLYSHIHVNVSTRFLTCEPPIMGNDYDESADFFANPSDWLKKNWDGIKPPTHVTFFDTIETSVHSFLTEKGFEKKKIFDESLFATKNSGRYIFVYEPS